MTSRRTVLTVAAAAFVAACTPSPSAVSAPVLPDLPLRVATRWTGRLDGPLPAAGDEGVPFSVIPLAGTPPTITGGALVGNLPPREGATYLLQRLDSRVVRVGATFGFGPGASSGAIGLLAVDDRPAPSGHCHLAIAPDRWIAGVVQGFAVQEVAKGDFAVPLPQDGSPLTADIQYRGDTATIALPDGTSRAISDPRFAAVPDAAVACWEYYKTDGSGADVRFYETWAG